MRTQLKNERGNFFLPPLDLNHGTLEPKVSVLRLSYGNPSFGLNPTNLKKGKETLVLFL